jgi:hypothetical protein
MDASFPGNTIPDNKELQGKIDTDSDNAFPDNPFK